MCEGALKRCRWKSVSVNNKFLAREQCVHSPSFRALSSALEFQLDDSYRCGSGEVAH